MNRQYFHIFTISFVFFITILSFVSDSCSQQNASKFSLFRHYKGLGHLDTLFLPLDDETTIHKLDPFHFSYPLLVVETYNTQYERTNDQAFLLINFDRSDTPNKYVRKNDLSRNLKYKRIYDLFITENIVYALSSNGIVYRIAGNGILIDEISLNIPQPQEYGLFSGGQLTIYEDKIFTVIQKAPYKKVFCDPGILEIAVFNLNGDFLYKVPIFNNKDLCGIDYEYRLDVFKYIVFSKGVMVFNIFQKEFFIYNHEGTLLETDTFSFLPLVKANKLKSNSLNDNKNDFSPAKIPHTALSNAFINENSLYVVKSDSVNNQSILQIDLKTKKILRSLEIDGKFISFDATQSRIFSIKEKNKNLIVISSKFE